MQRLMKAEINKDMREEIRKNNLKRSLSII